MLKGKTVILGVAGGIAAYKIAVLARLLVKQNCDVHVIMTQNATNFINPITFETLRYNKDKHICQHQSIFKSGAVRLCILSYYQ